jgi:hypothetical protein
MNRDTFSAGWSLITGRLRFDRAPCRSGS